MPAIEAAVAAAIAALAPEVLHYVLALIRALGAGDVRGAKLAFAEALVHAERHALRKAREAEARAIVAAQRVRAASRRV